LTKDVSDAELIIKIRTGNERALEVLMDRHKRLVRFKARPYFLVGADRDDLIQEGMIGLFKAVRDFNADANVPFQAFAEVCITRQLITAIKNATRQKHRPLNSYVSLNRDPSETSVERLYEEAAGIAGGADPVESVLADEWLKTVKEITREHLTPIEASVLNEYVGGKSYREIADGLDCQVKAVDNALQRVKRKVAGSML